MGWWILNTTLNVFLSFHSRDWEVVKFAATAPKRNRIYRQLSRSASHCCIRASHCEPSETLNVTLKIPAVISSGVAT
jgi:hypothetical protein